MKQRKTRHTKEFEFCIEGPAKLNNDKEYISEKVIAYSERQAFWKLARRLEKQRNQTVYLGNCKTYIIKVFFPDKATRIFETKNRKREQLVFHFF